MIYLKSSVETYYKKARENNKVSPEYAFYETAPIVLKEKGLLDDNDDLQDMLLNYSKSVGQLYFKASNSYSGSDKIRTKSGDIASAPHMTSSWKTQASNLGLDTKRSTIDMYLRQRLEGIYGDVGYMSICDIFGEACSLIKTYKHPTFLSKIIDIEFPISDRQEDKLINPVKMPSEYGGDQGIYFNGYIDMVGVTKEGKVVLVDHKSSKLPFKEDDIRYNVQLTTYAWAFEELTGMKVDYLAIYNLRDSEFKYTRVPSNKWEIINTVFRYHYSIKQETFYKESPEPYSPCLNSYGRPCPYLSLCWSTRAQSLGIEPPELVKESNEDELEILDTP